MAPSPSLSQSTGFPERSMRYLGLLLLLSFASSCTDTSTILKNCDGRFSILEEIYCGTDGTISFGVTSNVTSASYDGSVRANSSDTTMSTVVVWGTLTDPCQSGTIDYTYTCGGRTFTRSKTIPASSFSSTAPATITANPNGSFNYQVQIACCGGASEGIAHDVQIYAPRGTVIFAMCDPRTFTCDGNYTLEVSGQLSDPNRGTDVTLTIVAAASTCTVSTSIRARG